MKTFLRIFWAHLRANAWCFIHIKDGYCILTEKIQAPNLRPSTIRISAGTGSIFGGTWKTARTFYVRND